MNMAADDSQANLWVEADIVAPDHGVENDATPMANDDHDRGAPADTFGKRYQTGNKHFSTSLAASVPVFERASHDFTTGQIPVSSSFNGGVSTIVGRQPGRKSVTIAVPTSYVNAAGVNVTGASVIGVIIGGSASEIQNPGGGWQLNAGDSITLYTEAPVYAGCINGQTSGFCQNQTDYNPAGGELGGL